MSDIVYSVKFTPSESDSDNKYSKYFAIPVSLIKVLLVKGKKSELNHFERAVLSLLLNKFHTNKQIAEKLCINEDLTELIINDLKKKGLIDDSCKVLEKGEESLKGVYQNVTQENCYLIFDHNRQCFLPNQCNDNDLVFSQSRSNDENYSFQYENDAFAENVIYKYIKIDQKPSLNPKEVERLLRRDVFNKNGDECLIKFKIIELSKKIYHLISSVEVNLCLYAKKWVVNNPITLEPDNGLYNFFYNNSNDKTINGLLSGIIKKKMNGLDDGGKGLYDTIKNKLFTKEISVRHEEIIFPLINIIKALDESNAKNYSERVYRNQILSNAMVYLGDLFEKILYLGTTENGKDMQEALQILHREDSKLNKEILAEIAKSIGFDISENASKLLSTNRRTLKKIIKNPNAAQLGECIDLNLVLASKDERHFYRGLAMKYPGFINMMYEFKRNYRDKSKHTIDIDDTFSLRKYIDVLFEVLELSLGYKLNKATLEKLVKANETIYDYSYSEELIRLRLGNKIIDSNNKEITNIRFSLISMLDEYSTKSTRYLKNAYSLIDTYTKIIVDEIKKRYQPKYIKLSDRFNTMEGLEAYLVNLGFQMGTSNTVGNNVIDSLEFLGKEEEVRRSFDVGFDNAVLRIKTLSLIVMFLNDDDIAKKIIDLGMSDFFAITSNVSFLQGHTQVHEYNENNAKIIVDGVIKMTDFIVNKVDFIK